MKNFKRKISNRRYLFATSRGMSYVELIVVLGIFSALSMVVVFNYGTFQSKLDIKKLANDIALKIVETQKSSLSGKLPPAGFVVGPTWKPSYGTFFDINPSTENKSFIYFTDLDQDRIYDGLATCTVECINKINITKGNYISEIRRFPANTTIDDVTMTFARPNPGAFFSSGGAVLAGITYIQITLTSPKGHTATIKLYASGRIDVS